MGTTSMVLIAGIGSACIAAVVTPLVASWARRYGVVDVPGSEQRKQHKRPTPLLGGVAVYIAVTVITLVVAWATGAPFEGRVSPLELIAVLVGGGILVLGGSLDDRWRLRPWQQFCFPLVAAVLVAASGVGVTRVTNPFGGIMFLAPVITVAFTVVWLLGMTYTTKLLDGLDGLVAGMTTIGAVLIATLSLSHRYFQPDVAILSAILAGACAGFLVWNMHPARIFLGEGGSTLCGFLLGTLAIISGGKIATALLVMGIPALDVASVIIQRVVRARRVVTADRAHLHFRLLDIGLSHRTAVMAYWIVAAVFGVTTLFLQAFAKLITLLVLALVAVGCSVLIARRNVRTPTTHGGRGSVRP